MKQLSLIALTLFWFAVAGCAIGRQCRGEEPSGDKSAEQQNRQHWQGTFELVSMVSDGKPTPGEDLTKRKLTIEGNKYHFQSGNFSEHGSYKWDVTQEPMHVDIIVGEGADKGKVYLAAFAAKDGEIRLCFEKDNQKRPTALSGAAGSGQVLEVWRRVEP